MNTRTFALAALTLLTAFGLYRVTAAPAAKPVPLPRFAVTHTDKEWRRLLSPAAYNVTRQAGTEAPYSGYYDHHDPKGVYYCIDCGEPLFSSDTKFDSHTGWPSFYAPISLKNVILRTDTTLGFSRTEVLCARCGAHLGHVFDDGPPPTGQRFCMNSVALKAGPK